ncbi:MAG: biotin--[acetyl-CoA-carboxylase] ligase [Rhodobiaceae bacterium]|nr:MAG: biotin--[acetyl-CoA-carboxylase] ligase [Rhodobiaceae bacterium]
MTADVRLPLGYDLRRHVEIDSTNEEARRLANAGEPGPVWIVTERQTAGRGRRGRTWVSPAGNLMCTLLLRPACSPAKAGELSFVAGLALHDATSALVSADVAAKVALKWPNDLLIDGKKASGILLESESDGKADVAWLAIGIGLNLAHHPEDTPYPATCLKAQTGDAPSIEDALTALAVAFEHWFAVWQAPEGFAAVRQAWLERARGLGETITVRLSNEVLEGIFEGIAPEGALQLRLGGGTVRLISAGDVFFGSGGGTG